jgi:hypothetical protein
MVYGGYMAVAGEALKSSNISYFILGERMLLGIVEVYVLFTNSWKREF